MNSVEPIKNIDDIEKMKVKLKKHGDKYFIMFILGINTGLRISDIVKLKVDDVKDKDRVFIREKKTGKEKIFIINSDVKKSISNFINNHNLKDEDFLIFSNKGGHLERSQAYVILNKAAKECDLNIKIGTHTMRKTFGYWYYKRYNDVAKLMQIFNHSSPSITKKYIGLDQEEIEKDLYNFSL